MIRSLRAALAAVICVAFVALPGCAEWQAAATSFNSAVVAGDDRARTDEAVGLTELMCRLPYATIQDMAKVNPNYAAVISLNCGRLPETPFGVVAPAQPGSVLQTLPAPPPQSGALGVTQERPPAAPSP